jgi:hypothetical protein
MDKATLTVDSREFTAALNDLIKMSSREMPEVIDGVARDLCFSAAKLTKKARSAEIERLRGSKLAHALATMTGRPKGTGNKARADSLVNRWLAAVSYSKAIWVKIARDLGARLNSQFSIHNAKGHRAKPGIKPTVILEVKGLESGHVDDIMQVALNKAVPIVTRKMTDRVNKKLRDMAAKKSARR